MIHRASVKTRVLLFSDIFRRLWGENMSFLLKYSFITEIRTWIDAVHNPPQWILPCESDESDAAPEFSIVFGGELSRTHDIRPADICE